MGTHKQKRKVTESGRRTAENERVQPSQVLLVLASLALFSFLIYKGYSLYLGKKQDDAQRAHSSNYYEKKRAAEELEKAEQGKF